MTALDCPNPFQIPNHNEKNNYPLKRVSPLIQTHARYIGYELEVGLRICDKCRLYARNKYTQVCNNKKRKSKQPSRPTQPATNKDNITITPIPKIPLPQPKSTYMMPQFDSSDHNDSDEPYSEKYHQQQAFLKNNGPVDDTYSEYIEYSDEYNLTPNDGPSSSSNTNMENPMESTDNYVDFGMSTTNPVSELKIINVTSLPAEKHNEIMNNDDNAMNAMDSMYNHQLKISEIISSASNSTVFGIAKKSERIVDDPNTASSSKPYQAVPNKSFKKQHSKIQKMKQQMQNNYRLSGVAIQNIEEVSSASAGMRQESTDSDEQMNSKFNFNSKLNRRKNTLTPLDCEMEFVEINPPKLKKQAHMTDEQRLLSSQLETVKSIRNPNSDLLRKVAFLRVCVNYMMTELEGEPFNFGKVITYENLKTKYNSKRLS